MSKRVLTIIVSYNFMPWIEKCLGSVAASSVPTDVLVVDNASTDETVDCLRERYPEVKLIANNSNLGFGAANNIGLQRAVDDGYDFALLLNQDAWIDSDMLERLIAAYEREPGRWGILSPVQLTAGRDAIEKGFATYLDGMTLESLRETSAPLSRPFLNAAIWLLPVSTIKTVGMFSPLFYHYGEDKDYCNRVSYAGYEIGCVTDAFGVHDRADRKPTAAHAIRSEKVYALSEYANVNYSWTTAFARSVLAQLKKAVATPVVGRWKHLSIAAGLIGLTGRVLKQRKENKKRKK